MKKIIQTIFFFACILQLSCDILETPEQKKREKRREDIKSLFRPDNPVGNLFGRWVNCQKSGTIDIATEELNYMCYEESKVGGNISNYNTKEKITSNSISYNSGIKLLCGCNADQDGSWYKSPTQDTVTAQKVNLILKDENQPLTTYVRGDILYCLPRIVCPQEGVYGSRKYQKLIIQ